jgi:hypothetical protein
VSLVKGREKTVTDDTSYNFQKQKRGKVNNNVTGMTGLTYTANYAAAGSPVSIIIKTLTIKSMLPFIKLFVLVGLCSVAMHTF